MRLSCALLLLMTGCASVPPFQPSPPIEQTTSVQEGARVCNEYRMPEPSGRPIDLKPFLDCIDQIRERFPAAAIGNTAFNAFREEFHLMYGKTHDQDWSPRLGQQLELAIHAALRAIWEGNRPTVTSLEKRMVEVQFPWTARHLEAAQWKVENDGVMDPRLEDFKAGVTALSQGEGIRESRTAVHGARATPEMVELCQGYLHLEETLRYLEDLWQDQLDLEQLMPGSGVSESVRRKYDRNLDDAMQKLDEIRPKIADARAKGSFRVLVCRSSHA